MKVSGKINLIFAVLLLCFGYTIAFTQQNDSTPQKKKAVSNKNQKNVFDAKTATLEETQAWLKKIFKKYGDYPFAYPRNYNPADASRSRIENVKFNGCEISYNRTSYTQSGSNGFNLVPDNLSGASSTGDEWSARKNNPPTWNYTLKGDKKKISLTNLNERGINVIDRGKVFWVQISSGRDLSGSDANEKNAPNTAQNKKQSSAGSYKIKYDVISIPDKEIASQFKDALIRMITLCQ